MANDTQNSREILSTKAGWPISATTFEVGTIHDSLAKTLATRLTGKFGVSVTADPMNVDGNPSGFSHLVTGRVRLGINRYAEMRAYVEGYKAASY